MIKVAKILANYGRIPAIRRGPGSLRGSAALSGRYTVRAPAAFRPGPGAAAPVPGPPPLRGGALRIPCAGAGYYLVPFPRERSVWNC